MSIPTPDQTELEKIMEKLHVSEEGFTCGFFAKHPCNCGVQEALAAISKLIVLERIDELDWVQINLNIDSVKLNDRLAKLKKGI